MNRQRYVTNELTHFVGRGKSEDEQYDLMVNKILKEGWLTYPPHDRKPERNISVNLVKTISDGKMINTQVICFCDIPLADLDIHMAKYSRFGLSFKREFLLPFGACPVFYVANNATYHTGYAVAFMVLIEHLQQRAMEAFHDSKIERGLAFDGYLKNIIDLLGTVELMARGYKGRQELTQGRDIAESKQRTCTVFKYLADLNPEQVDKIAAIIEGNDRLIHFVQALAEFMVVGVMDQVKCFDATKAEDDPENYYMEREWRVPSNIQFAIADVCRVILPAKYGESFRKALPDYYGQVQFIE